MGARIEDIRILQGDSAAVAHGTASYASRSAVLAGGAAVLASRLLKEKVVRTASHLLEASIEDIDVAEGRVFVVGTDRSLTFRELAKAVYSEMGRLPTEVREELEVTKLYDPVLGTTTAATHIATLEVDPETYTVMLGRYVVAEDCGRVINPLSRRWQLRSKHSVAKCSRTGGYGIGGTLISLQAPWRNLKRMWDRR